MDDRGQIAMDFLLGVSLVLIAIGFTVQFVPGIFISGSAGEEKLGYAAYRTSCILTEDPGWWSNSTSSGTGWEKHTENVQRIGLAADDDINSRLTETPNLLSKEKLIKFKQLSETEIVRKLGLFDSVKGTQMNYEYNISFLVNEQPLVIDHYTMVRGKPLCLDQNMAKITRVVLLETGNFSVFDGRSLSTDSVNSSHANIYFVGPATEDPIIQITNFNADSNAMLINASINGSTLSSSDYTILRRQLYGNFSSYASSSPLLDNDSLRIDFNKNLFSSNKSYQVRLNFQNVTFTRQGPPFSSYEDNIEKIYEHALLVVEVW
ncbi:hypothetical protein [uncultured Methanomethylovorans sp.]|uniref:DUF7287 family protein n=1 Tax=uncultured Methanomethylovorans sp. TaxID=183759 RepID=UPI002AA6F2BB|nr:hypothetical protein [uncultured Methanomethylovorans sp.]